MLLMFGKILSELEMCFHPMKMLPEETSVLGAFKWNHFLTLGSIWDLIQEPWFSKRPIIFKRHTSGRLDENHEFFDGKTS